MKVLIAALCVLSGLGCVVLQQTTPQTPSKTLTDVEIGIFRDNGVTVTLKDGDATKWVFAHSGVPDHETGPWGNNPNEVQDQDHTFDIPVQADVLDTKGCVRLGPIGMAVNGVPFFNPYTAEGLNAVEGECEETFDDCSGHPAQGGVYHYHKLPACVYRNTANQLLGVALDGYPIYGPLDDTGRILKTTDLDECHGHMLNERYVYRITYDFPYIIGCFRGTALSTMGDRPPPSGGNGGPRAPRSVRTKRHGQNARSLHKRQAMNECTIQYQDWQANTCYAFCANPSDGSYDQCDLNSTTIVSVTSTTSAAPPTGGVTPTGGSSSSRPTDGTSSTQQTGGGSTPRTTDGVSTVGQYQPTTVGGATVVSSSILNILAMGMLVVFYNCK